MRRSRQGSISASFGDQCTDGRDPLPGLRAALIGVPLDLKDKKIEIQIPDDQAEKIKTVGEAVDYIEREKAKK